MYKQQTLGGYDIDDDLCSYSFNFTDRQGTHVSMSFQAEPEYDLSVVFQQFRKFLIASGHDVENEIGELSNDDGDYDDEESAQQYFDEEYEKSLMQEQVMTQAQAASKFSMDNLPNNGWPFGGLTTTSLAPISVTDLDTMTTHSYSDWAKIGKFPTMSPLTQEQIQSWSFSSADIKSLTVSDISNFKMPGTIGGASVKF